MWVLLLVLFSGPMEIQKVELLEYHWGRASCIKSVNEAVKVGLPPNTSIGCVRIKHITKA